MQLPISPECRRTYRMIQAHCAVRSSASVGERLRSAVGVKGDIVAIPLSELQKLFTCERRLSEAQRLIALAIHNKRRVRSKDGINGADTV